MREGGRGDLVTDSRGSLLHRGLAGARLLSSAKWPLFNGSSPHYFLP